MTTRSLTALAAGIVLTGSLVAVAAGPAMAQTYPSPTPTTTSPASPTITITYNASTKTLTITITGLKPGSTVTIIIVAQGGATGASYTPDGNLVIRTASYEQASALVAPALVAASQSASASAVADASGVAHVPVSLAAFGDLTDAQVAALQLSVTGTKANGTSYSTATNVGAAAVGGSTSAAAATGALPRTGSQVDIAPLAASGLGLLVVGGSIVMIARRRREDFVA